MQRVEANVFYVLSNVKNQPEDFILQVHRDSQ